MSTVIATLPTEVERARVRSLLRWSSLTALAGGVPWLLPAVVILGGAAVPWVALPVLLWLGLLAVVGSVLWARVIVGSGTFAPGEWSMGIGGIGVNLVLAAAAFAVAAPLGLPVALVVATLVPLSPLAGLAVFQGVPVARALAFAPSIRHAERRLTVVAVLWLTLQMVLAFGLGAVL